MRSVLPLLCLLLSPCLATAQSGQDPSGSQLLRACKTALKLEDDQTHLSMRDELEGGFCIGMVHGISSTLYLNRSPRTHVVSRSPNLSCVPKELSNYQAVHLVVGYLETHPERLGEAEGQLIVEALTQAFPCRTAE